MTRPAPDQSLDAWTAIDWSASSHDLPIGDRRVHFVDHGAGPAVVLIHGVGCSWRWWLRTIPALSATHRVIAVDLPGFGDSERLPRPFAMSAYGHTVTALTGHLGLDDFAVVGHSMGGIVAVDVALERPDRVSQVVLVDSAGIRFGPARTTAVRAVMRIMSMVATRPRLAAWGVRRFDLERRWLDALMHDPATIPAALMAELESESPGLLDAMAAAGPILSRPRAEELTCPVALVWGEHDRLCPPSRARRLAVHDPQARVEIIPRVGHTPMIEAPAAFNRLLLARISR